MTVSVNYKMPASEYHAHPAVNQSRLKELARAKTPRHFKTSLDKQEPDKAEFAFGTAFHTLVLEPSKFEESVLVWDKTITRGEKYKKFVLENPGKCVILKAELETLRMMAESFHTHPLSRGLLTGAKIEPSLFWIDPVTQMECKARLDILHSDIIWDVKTARDASLAGFDKAIEEWEYDRQPPWYLDGASLVLGRPITSFGWIVVEKEAPFEVQVFLCDERLIEKGRKKNAQDLATYANCIRTNKWPGYPTTIQTVVGRP